MLPSSRQIKAARALLDWSQADLAERAGIALSTVKVIERGAPHDSEQRRGVSLSPESIAKVRQAIEAAGVEFLAAGLDISKGGEGVRLRKSRSR